MSDTTQVPALIAGRKVAGIVPTTIEEVFRLAQAIAKSGLAPNTLNTAEKITIAIMHGLEIGLPPMMSVQKIAVVNGRPTIWGDAVPALLWSRGFKLDETCADNVANCIVTRPDGHKVTRTFSEADARKAGLWGKAGPWTQYPSRMLAMRARGLAARDGAADALSGLYLQEEIDGGELTVVPIERKSSAAAKRDGTKETFDNLMKAIEAAPEGSDLMTLRQEHADEWSQMPSRWANLLNEAFHYKAKDFGIDVDPDTGAIVDQATE
jgi:hypothetical protein